jgi:hypothetical protein
MTDGQYESAKTVLRLLIADLQAKVDAPQHYTEREREHNKRMLAIRSLELRDLEAARWGD